MIRFKQFLVERTYKTSSKEDDQIEEMLNRYHHFFDSSVLKNRNPEKLYKGKLNEDGNFFIGTIEYVDFASKETRSLYVEVTFDRRPATGGFDDNTNTILLFYYNFDKLSNNEKRNTILHEVLHAKQHYKKLRPQDLRAINKRTLPGGMVTIRSKQTYYTSPNEFPVQLSSLTSELERQYLTILTHVRKPGIEAKFWERQRSGFLRLLDTFIRQSTLPKDYPLPSYLKYQEDFIRTLFRIKNKPEYVKHYRKFKTTLYHFYERLSSLGRKNKRLAQKPDLD